MQRIRNSSHLLAQSGHGSVASNGPIEKYFHTPPEQ